MFFVAVVSAGGVSVIFVVSATGAAIPNNLIKVDNSKAAIPADMCAFAIVAVADIPARFRCNLQSSPHCGHPVLHAKFADH